VATDDEPAVSLERLEKLERLERVGLGRAKVLMASEVPAILLLPLPSRDEEEDGIWLNVDGRVGDTVMIPDEMESVTVPMICVDVAVMNAVRVAVPNTVLVVGRATTKLSDLIEAPFWFPAWLNTK
jgi:hypothetical protein